MHRWVGSGYEKKLKEARSRRNAAATMVTLHLSRMKAARHTSLILLGTDTTNCCRASGTAKLSDWSSAVMGAEGAEPPDTWMVTGSLRQMSASRVTPGE